MKFVKVLYKFQREELNTIVDGVLLENYADIETFMKEVEYAEEMVITKFVKSKESNDRYNHIVSGFRPLERSIANLAIARGKMKGENPLYLLGESTKSFLKTVCKVMEYSGSVFLNPSGTVCSINKDMEILEESEFTGFPNPPKFNIKKGSKVINLENDFELEQDAINYMNENFNYNYSHILDMKTYDDKDFIKVFGQFAEQGGEYVYVYTTGMDYKQMYQYAKCAIQSGLKKFIFDFNSGMDKNINEFVSWLSERAEVQILKQY